jgi:glycine betaine/proline transport system substrate-binding protein
VRTSYRASLAAIAIGLTILTGLACASAPEARTDRIIVAELGWDSARLQNRIVQYIIEKGYGYSTAVVPGGTVDLFDGLRRGESDLMMELWLPNHSEAWGEAAIAGEVVSLGESLSKLTQSAFMIPAYVQAAHPGLDTVDDLKAEPYRRLFATPDSEGKARLVSCPDGWACNVVNATQVASYGLADHVQIVVPESEAALHGDLFDRYENREPWLGYLDSSMAPALTLDLIPLEEPAYSDDCWATTKACAYDDTTLLIVVRPQVLERAPDVAAMLRQWRLTADLYAALAVWRIHNDADDGDAAIWWLNGHEHIWRGWVSEEAAGAIREALDRGERADGWPGD